MKRTATLCLTLFLLLLTACAPAPESTREAKNTRAVDETAIRALRDAFLESQRTGDVERIAAFYADDAIFMQPGAPSMMRIDAIRSGIAGFFGEYEWNAQEPIEELQVLGDRAFTRTSFSATRTDKKTGMAVKLLGKAVHIYRRQPDGTWKITIDIFNYDHPVDRS